jgi:hypothetical protein
MSWLMRPTEAEIIDNFEHVLASIIYGTLFGVPTDLGIDQQTEDSLDVLAAAPDKTVELINAARAEFAAQLDGMHADRINP